MECVGVAMQWRQQLEAKYEDNLEATQVQITSKSLCFKTIQKSI